MLGLQLCAEFLDVEPWLLLHIFSAVYEPLLSGRTGAVRT